MALKDFLELASERKKVEVSEERILAVLEPLRSYVAFWREYPDLMIDFMQTGGDPERPKQLKFYFYQRVFLRVCMRYKYVYMTFPRAYENAPNWKQKFHGKTSLIKGTLFRFK